MARTKQAAQARAKAAKKKPLQAPAPRWRSASSEEELSAMRREAERRKQIFDDRRRTTAKWRAKIPQVRKVNFENFKNRFQPVGERDYAIDVLMAGPGIQSQIRREQGRRRREDAAIRRRNLLVFKGLQEDDLEDLIAERLRESSGKNDKKQAETVYGPESEIARVRIQSQPVLGHLTALTNDTEKRSTPRTFMRPFQTLVYFQPKMREILAALEEKWGDYEDFDEPETSPDTPVEVEAEPESLVTAEDLASEKAGGTETEEDEDEFPDDVSLKSVDSNEDEDFEGLMDSPEALADMRCYVEFVDKEIMPLYQRFDGNTASTVKFEDLWSLYRPGDLIYMPTGGEPGGRYHEVWRIYRVRVPDPKVSFMETGWDFWADDLMQSDDNNTFEISAYYIDHDGTNLGAVRNVFKIDSFVGERAIESLQVYPIRYRHDHQKLIESLKDQGRKFMKYLQVEERHQQYGAWTITRNPPNENTCIEDEILMDEHYDKMFHPEFVESDVIVDLTEAYLKQPTWRPTFHHVSTHVSVECEAESDEMPIRHWVDRSRGLLAYAQEEIVQKKEGIEMRQRRENLALDTFLRVRAQGSRTFETNPKDLELREEDLVLLPKRMFAYALRERQFWPIDLNFLKPIRREPGVFENLKIQRDYKDVVRSLVMSHFQKKALERRYADASIEGPGQDVIQGKGRGLVVLLHGVPGVGKTATAEAVAMENKKPLFVITCGDLGLTPSEVEHSLKNVFRLAHLWDCVLLLDEADVFLSQRSKNDMKRNALVSVFLRVLEYYNGLLFLTTNRVGAIDEAFKSRINLSLYYPPLDKAQTRDIFRLNVAKLRKIESERSRMTGEPALVIKEAEIIEFASKHYEDLARSTGCWNGRQIRSAFQIASSLALHSYSQLAEEARARGERPPGPPVLDRSLFEKVQMSTQSFDRHMRKENGTFESQLPLRGTFAEED